MAENIQYDISVPEKYEKDGEEKTAWRNVGRAFANDSGNISLKISPNISVSGDVVLFKKDDKTAEE